MKDKVKDTDTHFIIDGSTRLVKNESETKSMLVQYDHNSERFTFRVKRYPDDHDLSECNTVRVHFINIDKSKRMENSSVDDITDTLDVCPDDDEYVICSWLIPDSATQFAGSLHFVIQFAVIEGKTVKYSWNTAKYTNITISDGIKNDEVFETEHIDILKGWEEELKANQIKNIEQTTYSDEDEGENVWTVTFGDERTQELKVRNGSKGETGLVGSIETVQKKPLHFFVGTKAEYEALSEEQKTNLFAIITDDSTDERLKAYAPLDNPIFPNMLRFRSTDTNVKCGGEIRRIYTTNADGSHQDTGCGMSLIATGDYSDEGAERALIKVFHSETLADKDRVKLGISNTDENGERTVKWHGLYGSHNPPPPPTAQIFEFTSMKTPQNIPLDFSPNATYSIQVIFGRYSENQQRYSWNFIISIPDVKTMTNPNVNDELASMGFYRSYCEMYSNEVSIYIGNNGYRNGDLRIKAVYFDGSKTMWLDFRKKGEQNWETFTTNEDLEQPIKIICRKLF